MYDPMFHNLRPANLDRPPLPVITGGRRPETGRE